MSSVDNLGTPVVPRVLVNYSYDAASNLLSTTDTIDGVTGATTTYSYDVLNRTTGITQSGLGVSNKLVKYTYDDAGKLTGLNRYSDLTGTNLVASSIYGYDNAGRLTSLNHNGNAISLANYTFGYDDANRITQLVSNGSINNYTYDNTSQLTSASNPGESYTYDDNGNRTNSGYSTGNNNQLSNDGTYNYEYDGEGNRTKRTNIANGEVTTYSWDYRNRLTQVVTKNSSGVVLEEADYTYDVNDKRIGKTVIAGGTTKTEKYVYDGKNIALVFDGSGNQTHRYLYGVGDNNVLADETSTSGQVLWALVDNQGTVKDVVDSNGTVLNHIVYDSFGNVTSITNSTAVFRFGYTGQEYDKETGLYYYYARYYDASNGKFISVDPLGFGGGDSNLYRYVKNNSINSIDPLGLAPCDCQDNNLVRGIQGDANYLGPSLINDSIVRERYVTSVAGLSTDDTEARTELKIQTRKESSTLGKIVAETLRPSSGESARVGGTANKTNSLINSLYGKPTRYLAATGTVLSVGQSIYNVVTAPEEQRGCVIAKEVGAVAGALAFGEAGTIVGGAIGGLFGGLGAIPGAIIGGAIGSAAGSILGSQAGRNIYIVF